MYGVKEKCMVGTLSLYNSWSKEGFLDTQSAAVGLNEARYRK